MQKVGIPSYIGQFSGQKLEFCPILDNSHAKVRDLPYTRQFPCQSQRSALYSTIPMPKSETCSILNNSNAVLDNSHAKVRDLLYIDQFQCQSWRYSLYWTIPMPKLEIFPILDNSNAKVGDIPYTGQFQCLSAPSTFSVILTTHMTESARSDLHSEPSDQ